MDFVNLMIFMCKQVMKKQLKVTENTEAYLVLIFLLIFMYYHGFLNSSALEYFYINM